MPLTVLVWNIAEGPELQSTAAVLRQQSADLVLLNEVRWDWRQDQAGHLAEAGGYAHHEYRPTTQMGVLGASKGVAILSRHPLHHAQLHRLGPQVPVIGAWGGFGTLQVSVDVEGLRHEVFSTRFAPLHGPESDAFDPQAEAKNRAAHEQTRALVQAVPPSSAVIHGGDMNTEWNRMSLIGGPPPGGWARAFRDTSGLREALADSPDPDGGIDPGARVDYLYYRGPYLATHVLMRRVSRAVSDHPYLLARLTRTDVETDDAVFVRQHVPGHVAPGQSVDVSVTFRNVGSSTWSAGHGYRLGSQEPGDNTRWGTNRVELDSPVHPGGDATFAFRAAAPAAAGRHPFVWRMVREHVRWFGQSTPRDVVLVASDETATRCADLKRRIGATESQLRRLQGQLRTATGSQKQHLLRQVASVRGSLDDMVEQARSAGCAD